MAKKDEVIDDKKLILKFINDRGLKFELKKWLEQQKKN